MSAHALIASVHPGPQLSSVALDTGHFHSGLAWITVACCALACVPAGLRWLRVAQREHYLGGSTSLFAWRWWHVSALNSVLAAVGVAAAVVSLWWPVVGVAVAVVVAAGPVGLSLRGRTSPLAWTRRLRTLAGVWAAVEVVIVVVGVVTGLAAPLAVVAALAVPLVVDVACWLTAPLEHRLGAHFVDEAAARLARVDPTVVAVTGSYGKTSTKGHVGHLVGSSRTVVVTPASFNNRAGLARAVNEHLADGTEVFVAEMGTYGVGEIADLCRWCPPAIAVITAIGPVHLERFGSEERIVEAKSEILEAADDVVIQVDDPRLAEVADRAAAAGKRVMRCSGADPTADVGVVRTADGSRLSAYAHGSVVLEDVDVPAGVQPGNLACAIAVALILKVDMEAIGARLRDLPSVAHRLQVVMGVSGVSILDDTYNSNPVGAAGALASLMATAAQPPTPNPTTTPSPTPPGGTRPGRTVVVTPGMVELGSRQYEENRRFGAAVAAVASDLLVVGRTNRRALSAGAASVTDPTATVQLVHNREQAVDWVRQHLGPGDAVLYENDLPDHYP